LIAFREAAIRANGAEGIGAQVTSECVGQKELETIAKLLAQAGFKSVVPTAAFRFDLQEVISGPPEQRCAQSNVIDGVGRFSANRMAGTGEGRLIRIALA